MSAPSKARAKPASEKRGSGGMAKRATSKVRAKPASEKPASGGGAKRAKSTAPAEPATKTGSRVKAKLARSKTRAKPAPVKLLSGGNPQIAKGDGDAPVQAYIAAMPGWQRDVGRWLDALVARSVPNVRKAVKWNSPFYGIEGQGWFLGLHCFTRYVKLSFFRGTSLRPVPPGPSKSEETRYVDIHEGDKLDDAQMANWVKQAAALPGWLS